MLAIERWSQLETVTLETTLSATPELLFGNFAGGFIYIPSGSSITSLTWYAAPDRKEGGTFLAANDDAGTAITQTVAANNAYALPADLYGAGSLKCVVNAQGEVSFSFKS